jgi:hypothetical protein
MKTEKKEGRKGGGIKKGREASECSSPRDIE